MEGVRIAGNNIVVMGNKIGMDATGTVDIPNGSHGVNILELGNANTIGGSTPGAGNLIAGNSGHGIRVAASRNIVQGNHIGTNPEGATFAGNGGHGIFLTGPFAHNNQIGGTVLDGTTNVSGNVISANKMDGIRISGDIAVFGLPHSNKIQGNFIGTNKAGTAFLLGNWGNGVTIADGANTNLIGGTDVIGTVHAP